MPVKDIRRVKSTLRDKSRAYRAGLKAEEKQALDSAIFKRLISLKQYRECSVLLTYVSTAIEVDTVKIILQGFADGKTVAVPRCIPGKREMDFYIIKSLDDLEKGTFGVLEPKTEICEKLTDFNNAFCIVPGLSFDCSGYRIGYGKGYYDRFLADFSGYKAGICYKYCVEWRFPHGFFDKKVDVLITEKYIRRTCNELRKECAYE